ncbi:MAG: TIM barrel protein [Bacteroidaceae bacterium]|nr:TIM barrel protein [Bacteroidaceae bacterium]
MYSRRDFLKTASMLTLGGIVGGSSSSYASSLQSAASASAARPNKFLGLQIWSLGKELYEGNVAENIKRIKDMGYQHIELAGYKDGQIGSVPMMDFKKMCDDVDLKVTCSHCNPPVWEYTKDKVDQITEYWKKTFEDHMKMGMGLIVQPSMPKIKNTEDAKFVCEVFNKVGELCQQAGMHRWGYHNHDGEFAKVVDGGEKAEFGLRAKGEKIIDLFLKHTDPKLVFIELDVYWTVMGQSDPAEYIRNHRNTHIRALHIKDDAVLGQSGLMNFEQIFKAANEEGENPVHTYYVEIEKFPKGYTQFQGAKECADFLLQAPYVK